MHRGPEAHRGTDRRPPQEAGSEGGEAVAISLLKTLRRIDHEVGVRNSRIAFDIALALYEGGPDAQASVDQLSAGTGYSGPTVRLVLKRLSETGTIQAAGRVGKTQFYALTGRGRTGFTAYVDAILALRGTGQPGSHAAD
ncbi:MAG TPA: hypothetical protein VE033_10465 [Acetobacteraceae bacterium]|jgi:hypothetical protein|nr:hypothetical protein [Acetobacteraceae bacterium]